MADGRFASGHSPFPIPHSALSRRPAFTLVETLLVLALLTVIAAIVWPALDKPFAAERLRKSADQLRADLTKARVASMNSGHTFALRFDTALNRYVAQSVETVEAASAHFFRALPEGISVYHLESLDDVTSPPVNFAAPTNLATPSTTVYFHPDGTTSTAVFGLRNENGDVVRIDLRGLTGATSVDDVASLETGR